MNDELDAWWGMQSPDERTAFNYARDKSRALGVTAEYWFMKGWVAKSV